jgi:hypothetical protein
MPFVHRGWEAIGVGAMALCLERSRLKKSSLSQSLDDR